MLDFRLAKGLDGDNNARLRDIIKGEKQPHTLFQRLEAQQYRALNRGEIGRYLVTFVDNHDSFWQGDGRIAATATDKQVIAAIGFLLCAIGTPCIYYGTEQGFEGKGEDNDIREAMFDMNDMSKNLLNTNCTIYKEISKIAEVMRATAPLRFGRMYYREISGDGINFGLPFGNAYTLAFSRIVYGREVLVAYNVSDSNRSDYVIVDTAYHKKGDSLHFLYGDNGTVQVNEAPNGSLNVQLILKPHQFVILE